MHQTYGRCWCSQSKRDALVFFSDSSGLAFYVFNQPPKTIHKHPPYVSFDVQCTTLVCWKPLDVRPTPDPNVQSQTLVFIIYTSKPCKTQPMFAFSLGFWLHICYNASLLCLFCCIHCFWTPEKTKMQAIVMVKFLNINWTCQLLNTCRSGK